jgi:hypothetical protein
LVTEQVFNIFKNQSVLPLTLKACLLNSVLAGSKLIFFTPFREGANEENQWLFQVILMTKINFI